MGKITKEHIDELAAMESFTTDDARRITGTHGPDVVARLRTRKGVKSVVRLPGDSVRGRFKILLDGDSSLATALRCEWMRRQGFHVEEIAESLKHSPAADPNEERRQLNAMLAIEEADREDLPKPSERLPQRFRYVKNGETRWGVCFPVQYCDHDLWNVECTGGGFSRLRSDPLEAIRNVLDGAESFKWLDNDYGWATP